MRFHSIVLTVFLVCPLVSEADKTSLPGPQATLGSVISESATRLGLHFTVEQDERSASKPQWLQMQVDPPVGVVTLADLFAYIKREIPDADLVVDGKTIHIVSHSLIKDNSYLLNDSDSVQFKGSPTDLLTFLGSRTNGQIVQATAFTDLLIEGIDGVTRLNIDAHHQTYRNILTDFVPMDGYSAIVWSAQVSVVTGKTSVSVLYYGPVQQPTKYIPLMQFLPDAGEKFGLYFTLERDQRVAYGSSLERRNIIEPIDLKTGDDLLAYLRRERDDAVIISDPTNAKVFHIVEKTLLNDSKYRLDEKVQIKFKGTPSGLLDLLYKQSNGFFLPTPDRVIGMPAIDRDTSINVDAKGEGYRSVLSNGLPLDHYSHLLWVGDAEEISGNLVIQIYWQGTVPQ
jgi:hypothetical protein